MIKASVRELELKITVEDFKGYLKSMGLETLTKWLEQASPDKDPGNAVMNSLCVLFIHLHKHIKPEDKIHALLGLNSAFRLHHIDTGDDFDYVNLYFILDAVNVNLDNLITTKGGKNEH